MNITVSRSVCVDVNEHYCFKVDFTQWKKLLPHTLVSRSVSSEAANPSGVRTPLRKSPVTGEVLKWESCDTGEVLKWESRDTGEVLKWGKS